MDTAEPIEVERERVPVIRREYFVAMWLFAGRAKDYQKIAMFWDAGLLDIAALLDILERYDLRVKWEREKWRFENG